MPDVGNAMDLKRDLRTYIETPRPFTRSYACKHTWYIHEAGGQAKEGTTIRPITLRASPQSIIFELRNNDGKIADRFNFERSSLNVKEQVISARSRSQVMTLIIAP